MFAANIYHDQRMRMRQFASTICPTSFLKLCMENLDNTFLLVVMPWTNLLVLGRY